MQWYMGHAKFNGTGPREKYRDLSVGDARELLPHAHFGHAQDRLIKKQYINT